MELTEHFHALHSNLTLEDASLGPVRSAHRGLRDALSRSPGELVIDTFLHGSFAHHTIIRPRGDGAEFRVDAMAVLDLPAEVLPSVALSVLHQRLIATYGEHVTRGRRSIRVRFNGFHLNVMPARPEGAVLAVPDARCAAWIESNPHGLSDWHRTQNERTAGRVARAIRMVKQWCADSVDDGSAPSSVVLDVLVAREVPQTGTDGEVLARVFRTLSTILASGRRPIVINPTMSGEDLARDWDPTSAALFGLHVARASALANAALTVWHGSASVELWRALFPERFPRAA